jgi:hypothetical protein
MHKILLAAALATAALGINGCAQQETMPAAAPAAASGAEAGYQAALAAAKAEQKKAAAVGGEWRDTGKTIKQAEEAAAAGDYAKAKKLADQAAFESRMGQEQAASQVNVGNPAYLY